VSESEALGGSRSATVDLKITAVPACGNIDGTTEPIAYAISATLALNQALWVVEKGIPKRVEFGDTWSKGSVMYFGRTTLSEGGVEKKVADMTDAFANDWLAAHGK
jgi:elongation factor P hydroxylase